MEVMREKMDGGETVIMNSVQSKTNGHKEQNIENKCAEVNGEKLEEFDELHRRASNTDMMRMPARPPRVPTTAQWVYSSKGCLMTMRLVTVAPRKE